MPFGWAAAGALLGPSVLGGGGGSNTNPKQTTTSYNAVSNYAAPYVEDMLGQTKALVNQPYQTYDQQRTADFTGMQNQAFNAAGNMGIMGQTTQGSNLAGASGIGALGVAQNATPQNFQQNVGQYMNPYVQQNLAPQLQAIGRTGDQQKTMNAGQATQAGAFGGSRFGIQNAMTDYNTQQAQAQALGAGLNSAYTNAQNQYNQANQTQLAGLSAANTAAGTLGQLGQNQYAQQTGNINLQNQLGTQQQQQQQNILNQQYQDFLTQKQDPYNKLAFQQSMLSGLPISSNTQNVYSNPSMLSQVAGLGTAAAGAYGLSGIGKAKGGSIKESKRPAGLAELALSKMA